MKTWRWYSKVGLGIILFLFAWLVWPTPWRYFSGLNGAKFRQLRIGGRIEKFDSLEPGKDWQAIKPMPVEKSLNDSEQAIQLAKKSYSMDRNGNFDNDGYIRNLLEEEHGALKIIGWKAEKISKGSSRGDYLVSFTYQRPKQKAEGWFWAVNLENAIVRQIGE